MNGRTRSVTWAALAASLLGLACDDSSPSSPPASEAAPEGPVVPAGSVDPEEAAATLVTAHLFKTADQHVGVAFTMAEGWHVYWANPGDAGLPTEIAWTVSEGRVESTLMPAPERFVSPGDVTSFGYAGTTAMFARYEAPPNATLGADVVWLACRESCIRGNAALESTLAELPTEEHAKARVRLPAPLPSSVTPVWSGTKMSVALAGPLVEFFPLDTDPAFLDSVDADVDDDRATLALDYRVSTSPNTLAGTAQALGVAEIRGPEGPMFVSIQAEWPR